MNLFEEIASRNIKCEICGGETIAVHGCGWDNDRIHCTNDDCLAEIEFMTTTNPNVEDYKYSIGQRVVTEFNGSPEEVVITRQRPGRSESGKLYQTEPRLGGSGWIDESWLYHPKQENLF